jgi:hypothetical protein
MYSAYSHENPPPPYSSSRIGSSMGTRCAARIAATCAPRWTSEIKRHDHMVCPARAPRVRRSPAERDAFGACHSSPRYAIRRGGGFAPAGGWGAGTSSGASVRVGIDLRLGRAFLPPLPFPPLTAGADLRRSRFASKSSSPSLASPSVPPPFVFFFFFFFVFSSRFSFSFSFSFLERGGPRRRLPAAPPSPSPGASISVKSGSAPGSYVSPSPRRVCY